MKKGDLTRTGEGAAGAKRASPGAGEKQASGRSRGEGLVYCYFAGTLVVRTWVGEVTIQLGISLIQL
jgi:hypothetical protein